MDKNINLVESVSDLLNLKAQVAMHQTWIDNLKFKMGKLKIYGYEALTYWMFVALEILVCLGGIIQVIAKGYPWWTSLSLIYLLLVIGWLAYKRRLRGEEYLKNIKYDAATYLDDEYNRQTRPRKLKNIVRSYLLMLPVFIHTVFVAIYLHNESQLGISGKYWWLILLAAMVVLTISFKLLIKNYFSLVLDAFRRNE